MRIKPLSLSLVIALCAVSFAAAEGSSDEEQLQQVSTRLDKDGEAPEGPRKVESRLMSEYKVDAARVQGLREQKLGYGEISIVLALAEKRPGGITDANVDAIMAERKGPPVMGWGQIAKKQGVKLGGVVGKMKRMDSSARKQEKAERMKHEKHEKREKADRPERAERSERHEKSERTGHAKH